MVKTMMEMTKREFFEAVMAVEEIDAELKLYAEKEIAKMDERNAKRKATPSKKSEANEPIKAEIVKILTEEPITASAVAEKVGISTQKASALLRQIDGLTVTEVKVKGKGKVKGYALAQSPRERKSELTSFSLSSELSEYSENSDGADPPHFHALMR